MNPIQLDEESAKQLDVLAQKHATEVSRLVGQRQSIEDRWLEDLRNYNGVYDEKTLSRIRANEGSELFVNITRSKSRVAESRLSDMLFPTDDTNWALKPTPVPDITMSMGDQRPMPGKEETFADLAQKIMAEAKKRGQAMTLEIEDQLTEASYSMKCREVIHDAVVVGTGVIKGPIVFGRTRKAWKREQGPNGQSAHVLKVQTDKRPGVHRVDPWNFFPEMSVAQMKQCSKVYERIYQTTQDMLKLAKDPFYIRENVLRAIKAGPKQSQVTRNPINEKRDTGYNNDGDTAQQEDGTQYEVWEFHGPISLSDLKACGCSEITEDDDPTNEVMGCVVFCNGIVIKAYLNPLETGELPYSVFCYERDESCIFGYGVPYRLRNAQRVVNAAWRTLMDNTGLSSGPQVVINRALVQPSDGDYRLKPRKVWELTDRTHKVHDVMATFDIPSHQPELKAIIEMAMSFADTESGIPLIAQGDQAPAMTKTFQGMALLMNSANLVTRSTVKNFDDGVTSEVIGRFYDWNMQNNPKEEIKGDYEVDARGSSVLLTKEIQAQNLMALATGFATHPIFGPMTKAPVLYRRLVQSMQVSEADIVLTDQEMQAQAEANQGGGAPPEIQVEQMRQSFEIKQAENKYKQAQQLEVIRHQNRMQEYKLDQQMEMLRMVRDEKMSVEQMKARMQEVGMKIQGDRQKIADETRVKLEFGSGI